MNYTLLKKAVQSAPTKSIANETLENMKLKLPPRLRTEAFKESSAELFAEVTADYEASMKRALGMSDVKLKPHASLYCSNDYSDYSSTGSHETSCERPRGRRQRASSA